LAAQRVEVCVPLALQLPRKPIVSLCSALFSLVQPCSALFSLVQPCSALFSVATVPLCGVVQDPRSVDEKTLANILWDAKHSPYDATRPTGGWSLVVAAIFCVLHTAHPRMIGNPRSGKR
jgi:hypothetical protein